MTVRRVYYNSACPVCRAGVNNQRDKMRAAGTGRDIEWCDVVKDPEALEGPGIDIDEVRRKLYVEDEHGRLHIGAAAFSALWLETPERRWIGRMMAFPGLSRLARWGYDRFADALYAWNRRHGRW